MLVLVQSAGIAGGGGANISINSKVSHLSARTTNLVRTPIGAQKGLERLHRPIRDKWALIIGINKFEDSAIPPLKYADKDARDFYNFLTTEAHFAPDHVRLLLNDTATERRVMSELGNKFLARVAKPDDLIVLFVSSHGSSAQFDLRGKNYILAYDSDHTDLYSSAIEMQKILESIQERVLSSRVLLVLDTCHSGAADPNSKAFGEHGNFDAEELAQGSGQLVICSSSPKQKSFESQRYPNGVFTRRFLEVFGQSKKKIRLSEAFQRIQQAVADEVQEDYPGNRQTPLLRSKWDGNDLILTAPPSHPQALPDSVKRDLLPDSSGPVRIAKPSQLHQTLPATNQYTRTAVNSSAVTKPILIANQAKPVIAFPGSITAGITNAQNAPFSARINMPSVQPETRPSGTATTGNTAMKDLAIAGFFGPNKVTNEGDSKYDSFFSLTDNERWGQAGLYPYLSKQKIAQAPSILRKLLFEELHSRISDKMVDLDTIDQELKLLLQNNKEPARDLKQVARIVGARYILVGSIEHLTYKGNFLQPSDYGIVLSLYLISGDNGKPVWRLDKFPFDRTRYENEPMVPDEHLEGVFLKEVAKELANKLIQRYK